MLVAALGALGAIGLLLLQWLMKAQVNSRTMMDQTQLRAIQQAIVTWGSNNTGRYPLPSSFDVANTTVSEIGSAKDTTANMFSMLIWNGSIPGELCVSPAETNPMIQPLYGYQYQLPKAAVDPANALWDPAFSADFTGGKVGNFSYAHTQPAGGRRSILLAREAWPQSVAMLSTRGPEVRGVTYDNGGRATIDAADPKTRTTNFFGKGTEWKGHVLFGDGHVDTKTMSVPRWKPKPGELGTYKNDAGREVPDAWFYDEPDDPGSVNNYLGIFTTAGEKPSEFRAIWD